MRVVIIEDEPHARMELRRLLASSLRDIEVVAELESVEDSVTFLSEHSGFDLIFLDIQLSDGLSFDIFRDVQVDKPVIFTTAYNEYAIKAFELNSVDYLLKPIDPAQLAKALDKFVRLTPKPVPIDGDQLRAMLGLRSKGFKSRFLVKIGDQFRYIPAEDIAYFHADRNTISLVTSDNKRYVIDYRLDDLEAHLDPASFFRITRSYIIHIKSIRKVHKYFNSRLLIEVNPSVDEQLLVSRIKADSFLNWLDN